MADTDLFAMQDDLYTFPYHHIPHFDEQGYPVLHRALGWGLEYLCYLNHVVGLVEALNPKSVLDVGCGDGRFLGLLSLDDDRKVGIDLSEKAVLSARAFHPNIDFRIGGAADLDRSFDVVTAIEVLEHVPDHEVSPFLQGVAARVAAGGYAVFTVPSAVVPVNAKHYRHYTADLFREQLAAAEVNLVIDRVEYVFRDSRLIWLYRVLTHTRFWYVEFRPVVRLLWSYAWRRLRIADARRGKHLVIVLKKQPTP
jgi:2-polyprenyl-3-methyl-5-hydroxy-6-metoxy-1,4-benzoquinol methylase